MSHSPEQNRKKAEAMRDAEHHSARNIHGEMPDAKAGADVGMDRYSRYKRLDAETDEMAKKADKDYAEYYKKHPHHLGHDRLKNKE